MAEQIEELVSGQAPSLMQAEKGNELIRAINGLKQSRGMGGIDVKVDKGGELVISQSGQKSRAFVFVFADGGSWTVPSEVILPAIITPFMSIEFHVDGGQVKSNYSGYGGDASFPVKLETHQDDPDKFFGGFFDGDADNDQTYTRVPIIASGRYINTIGIWQESTICYDGVPVQQFIKI